MTAIILGYLDEAFTFFHNAHTIKRQINPTISIVMMEETTTEYYCVQYPGTVHAHS